MPSSRPDSASSTSRWLIGAAASVAAGARLVGRGGARSSGPFRGAAGGRGQVVGEAGQLALELGELGVGPALQGREQPVEERRCGPGRGRRGRPAVRRTTWVRASSADSSRSSSPAAVSSATCRLIVETPTCLQVARSLTRIAPVLLDQVQDAEAGGPRGERHPGHVAPEHADLAQRAKQLGDPVARADGRAIGGRRWSSRVTVLPVGCRIQPTSYGCLCQPLQRGGAAAATACAPVIRRSGRMGGHDSRRPAARRARPGLAVRRVRRLGRRAGARALPGADRGPDRARLRQQRRARDADRVGQEPGRDRRACSRRSPRASEGSGRRRSRRWCRRSSSRCAPPSAPRTSACSPATPRSTRRRRSSPRPPR